ncbi:MAG: trypsin-like serine protease [Myxococcota bacterium]
MIHLLFPVAAALPPAVGAASAVTDAPTEPRDSGAPALGATEDGVQTQIINGVDATVEDWPMAGGMLLNGDVSFQGFEFEQTAILCSSTLIAPDVVMLAAHCVDLDALTLQLDPSGQVSIENPEFYWTRRKNLSMYQLGAPPTNLPEDAVRAVKAVMHEEFDLFRIQLGLANNKDIALLFLETPILDVPLGYLPVAETTETEIEVGNEVVVVGWGQQTATGPGETPPAGSYGVKMMGTSFVAEVAPPEFKVGQVQSDVRKCHGDSGGPSFMQVETESSETWRVVGVTSHSYDLSDCSTTGGVDTRVSRYLDWIDGQMRAACADGTRSWCEIEGIVPPPLPDGTLAWEIADEEEDAKKACGCSSNGAGAASWLVLGALALVRRRR